MQKEEETMRDACTTSVLGFYNKVPTQNEIISSQLVEIPCFTALPKSDQTPLEFRVDRGDTFVNLAETYVHLVVQVVDAQGNEIAPGTKISGSGEDVLYAPINQALYALFEDVDLYLNDQRITNPDSCYPYTTYVYNLLYRSTTAKQHFLRGLPWYKDLGGEFDTISLDVTGNDGFRHRVSWFGDSKRVNLYGQLLLNKQLDRLIPPDVDVMLKFHKAPPGLTLMSNLPGIKVNIVEAKLYVTKVKLTDSALSHYHKLLHGNGLSYNVNSVVTKVRTVSGGDQNVEWVPFTGVLPKRIYFFQISHEAYNADYSKNPYRFQTFRMNRFQVYKNGLSLPTSSGLTGLQERYFLPAYETSAKAINSHDTFDISLPDYRLGYLVICVDLSSDGNAGALDYSNPVDTGTLRIAIDYEIPLNASVTLFCVGEFSEQLLLKGREVKLCDGT